MGIRTPTPESVPHRSTGRDVQLDRRPDVRWRAVALSVAARPPDACTVIFRRSPRRSRILTARTCLPVRALPAMTVHPGPGTASGRSRRRGIDAPVIDAHNCTLARPPASRWRFAASRGSRAHSSERPGRVRGYERPTAPEPRPGAPPAAPLGRKSATPPHNADNPNRQAAAPSATTVRTATVAIAGVPSAGYPRAWRASREDVQTDCLRNRHAVAPRSWRVVSRTAVTWNYAGERRRPARR